MSIQPLAGIRVLDFTSLPPGGYCTVLLADLGAEVVRIEPPSQRGKPSLVIGQMGLSRAKRSMTLDMRNPHANDVLRRLITSVDVVVENAKPGAMEAKGFGYAQAAELHPGIVWCAITGFGQDGPYADQAGHDISYLAHSGLLAALSPELPWHPAAMLAVPIGGLMAVAGIQSALIERTRSGRGALVDIAMTDAATWFLSGAPGALDGSSKGIPVSPDRRLYACADGRFVAVAAAEPRTWGALCEGLGLPELADTLHNPDAAEAATARLAQAFATRPAAEWVALLGPRGAAVTAVNAGRAVVDDPHNSVRGSTLHVAGQDVPANPIRLRNRAGECSTSASAAPHKVGEDGEAILAAAGYAVEDIAALREQGII